MTGTEYRLVDERSRLGLKRRGGGRGGEKQVA